MKKEKMRESSCVPAAIKKDGMVLYCASEAGRRVSDERIHIHI